MAFSRCNSPPATLLIPAPANSSSIRTATSSTPTATPSSRKSPSRRTPRPSPSPPTARFPIRSPTRSPPSRPGFIREWLLFDFLVERFHVPNFQESQIAEHCHFTANVRRLAQSLRDQQAPLPVHLYDLPVIVHTIEE